MRGFAFVSTKSVLVRKIGERSGRTNQRLVSTPKRCNTLYLARQGVRKRTENFHVLCPFSVGAFCERPRANAVRPYEDDFLSAGKTCFMEGIPCEAFLTLILYKSNRHGAEVVVSLYQEQRGICISCLARRGNASKTVVYIHRESPA